MVETQNGSAGPVVGFLGLGIMGAAMASNLLKSGKFHKVVVWNRTLSKVRSYGPRQRYTGTCPSHCWGQCRCAAHITYLLSCVRCAAVRLQCDQLVAEGAVAASTPAEVVQQCDITFAMLADPDAALKVNSAAGMACPVLHTAPPVCRNTEA